MNTERHDRCHDNTCLHTHCVYQDAWLILFRYSLVEFIAKFLQFQPEVQQNGLEEDYNTVVETLAIKELLLNFGIEETLRCLVIYLSELLCRGPTTHSVKRAPIVSQRVDQFRERTQPQLGTVHDP